MNTKKSQRQSAKQYSRMLVDYGRALLNHRRTLAALAATQEADDRKKAKITADRIFDAFEEMEAMGDSFDLRLL